MCRCGAASCIVAGYYADILGRTTICLASLSISGQPSSSPHRGVHTLTYTTEQWVWAVALGLMSLVVGNTVASTPAVLGLGIVWGLAVIADSGQYSAM